jgi:hypothetical protein
MAWRAQFRQCPRAKQETVVQIGWKLRCWVAQLLGLQRWSVIAQLETMYEAEAYDVSVAICPIRP